MNSILFIEFKLAAHEFLRFHRPEIFNTPINLSFNVLSLRMTVELHQSNCWKSEDGVNTTQTFYKLNDDAKILLPLMFFEVELLK